MLHRVTVRETVLENSRQKELRSVALTGPAIDYLTDFLRVQSQFHGHGKNLCQRRGIDVEQKLVDQLGKLAAAGAAHVEDFVADAIEEGPDRFENFLAASAHHRESAFLRPRLHAGDGSVEKANASRLQALCQLQRGRIAHGAQVHDNLPFSELIDDSIPPHQHILYRLRARKTEEDDLSLYDFRKVRSRSNTLLLELRETIFL